MRSIEPKLHRIERDTSAMFPCQHRTINFCRLRDDSLKPSAIMFLKFLSIIAPFVNDVPSYTVVSRSDAIKCAISGTALPVLISWQCWRVPLRISTLHQYICLHENCEVTIKICSRCVIDLMAPQKSITSVILFHYLRLDVFSLAELRIKVKLYNFQSILNVRS